MDMTDAVNISLFAKKTGNEDDCVAVWYIFPADRATDLRSYLEDKYKDDPTAPKRDVIHGGWVVFDEEMLLDLMRKTRLQPWRIYQHPGDMVFIPSRCPHMVRCTCAFSPANVFAAAVC